MSLSLSLSLSLPLSLLLSLVFTLSSAHATEFDFDHPDEILKEKWPLSPDGLKLVEYDDLPAKVKATMFDIEIAVELGDGYYDILKEVHYAVYSDDGKLVGYIRAGLYSYTEDDDLTLAWVRVNLQGRRLDPELEIQPYGRHEIDKLPIELQP